MRFGYFTISLIIAAFWGTSLSSFLPNLIEKFSAVKIPASFLRVLADSLFISLSGSVAFFGIIFFALCFILPALRVVFILWKAKFKLNKLPNFYEEGTKTTVKSFTYTMDGLSFMNDLIKAYVPYLQENEAEPVLNSRKGKIRQIDNHENKNIQAFVPAHKIFKLEKIVDQNIFLWFFKILPRAILGAGGVLLIINLVAIFVIISQGFGAETWSKHAVIGMVAFGYCFTSALIIWGGRLFFTNLLRKMAGEFTQNIDLKFYQTNGVSAQDSGASSLANNENLLDVLDLFIKEIRDGSRQQSSLIRGSLETCVTTADQFNKILQENNAQVIGHYEKQALLLEAALTAMGGKVDQFEKATEASHETIRQLIGERNTVVESLRDCFQGVAKAAESSDKLAAQFDKVVAELESVMQRASAENLGAPSYKIPSEIPANIDPENILSEVEKLKLSFSKLDG